MEFSNEFAALRDRLRDGLDNAFISRQNVPVAGRIAALLSSFRVESPRKLLGMVSLGGVATACEYRLLFAAPGLDGAALGGWWQYAKEAEAELVEPDETHAYSLVSLILISDGISREAQKQVKKLSAERQYSGSQKGWSAIRIAAADLSSRRVYTNMIGDPLKNILRPFL